MTPQPTPPPRTPEQIAAEIGEQEFHRYMVNYPYTYTSAVKAIEIAIQSKQDEIDKLRTRAEQAEARLPEPLSVGPALQDRISVLMAKLKQAERERDEALKGCNVLASIVQLFSSGAPDNACVYRAGYENSGVNVRITLGHCRRAAEIIAKLTKK